MGEVLKSATTAPFVARISAITTAAALCLALAACGGRVANPVPERTALDGELSCRHVIAEKRKLKKRIADLKDERNENRRRSLARVPGAVFSGNPFSAIFFADPSVAIYKEINAAKRRNRVLDELLREKGCIAPERPAPAAATVTPPVIPATAPAQPEPPKEVNAVEAPPAQAAETSPAPASSSAPEESVAPSAEAAVPETETAAPQEN